MKIKNGFKFQRDNQTLRVTKLKKDGTFIAVFDLSDNFAFISHISAI